MFRFLLKLHYNYRSFGGYLQVFPKKWLLVLTFCLFSSFRLIWVEWAPFYSFLLLVLLELSLQSSGCLPAAFAACIHYAHFQFHFGLKHFQISLGIAPLIFGSLEIDTLIFLKLFEEFGKHFLMWTTNCSWLSKLFCIYMI